MANPKKAQAKLKSMKMIAKFFAAVTALSGIIVQADRAWNRTTSPAPTARNQKGFVALRESTRTFAVASTSKEERSPVAVCQDGEVSYALGHSGACSHHGGVKVWLR